MRTFYFLPITPIPLVHRGVLTTDAYFDGQAVTGTLSGATVTIEP